MIGGGNFSSVLVHMLNYAEEIGREDLWRLAVPDESPPDAGSALSIQRSSRLTRSVPAWGDR